ncbi:tRNA ligase [Mucor velutinosus]|uniref:tRNA ligase n=1 Tax=Mucor velutinosus TaxID=708070 RepID=A0AAN7HP07_9FUNG|nr:tRNA ligase [Mucor velutinosus]
MASKEEDSELLRGALGAIDVEKQNVELEATVKSLSETKLSLQNELEKERAEKQKLAEAKADAERSRTEAVEKFEDLCQSERRLREREQYNLQTLAQQRESLNDTQQKLNKERQTNMQKSFEVEKLSNLVRSLTNKEQSLNHELEDSNSKIKSLNSQINHLQELYDNLREDSNSERTKLLEKISNFQSETKQLQNKVDQLEKELEHARIRVIEAENSLGELTRSKDQMELTLGSTQKAFKDLQALYDAHTSNTRSKFSSYEAKIDHITKEKEELAKQNKDLEDQLAQERELRKVNFNQMTGVTTETASGEGRPTSNLLRLIQDYQNLKRRPEDIFEDFFELKDKYSIAVKSNANLNGLIEQLSRKQREKEIEFDRLYRELKLTGNKNTTLETSLKDQKKAYQQLTDANTKLQSDYSALQRDNTNLTASLNDTTYQLQHILSVIQKRSEPIPAGLKESASLLRDANIKPVLSHQELVYDNVAQLQDLNKELSVQVRTLREQLKEAQNKIGSSTIAHTSDISLYKQALEEAKQATSDLSSKVTQLQSKIDTTTIECENYKKIVNELGDGDAKVKFEQMQDTQERQRQEMDITLQSYRKETMEEMNKLKEELINSRASEKRVQSQLTSMEVEKRNLLVKLEKLNSHSQRIESQSNSLVRDNAMLNERILQSDQELSSIKKEIADYKSRLQLLREENMVLQTRYEAMHTSYKEFREMRDKESSDKNQMASLLEALKTRFDHITAVDKNSAEQSLETVEKLTRELQHARDTLATTEKQLDYYKSIDQSELQDKYKESVAEVRFLKKQITEIEQKLSDANQERIIAQTKLATTEEQLKKALSSAENASSTATLSSSCDEHVRLLAEAEDRVRILENDNNAYQTIIAEKEKLISASTAEHDILVTKTQASIDKLLKDIEERNEAVRAAQEEAEKSIAEYNALKQQSVASQAELADEKAKLDEKIKQLEASTTSMQEEITTLKQALEVKTNALADVEAKLESESKLAEEQRQANSDLCADVSNLTFEISQYKATIAAAAATEAKLRSDLEHETNERNTAEESWKNKLAELNKQQEQLSQSVSDLVAKYAEWAAANDKQDGPERAGFVATTEDIVKQLRETNTTLRIEKDASELNYQTERSKRRRVESEMEAIKTQVATLRADIARLREENKNLLNKSSTGALEDKMQYEAFKSQNQLLMMENSQLREAKQKALMEQASMEAQISPLELKVSSLEAELTQAKSEVEVLEKSQKEWTARSAKLLSKYNRVDPAEIESVKAELETTKKELETTRSELETLKTEKSSVESTVEELQAKIKSNESDRASLVQKANERGRMAFELRKKLQATTQQLADATKSTEANNDTASKAEVTKLTQEKETLETQIKDLTAKSTREKEALETQVKDLTAKLQDNNKQSGDVKEKEAELAQKTEAYTALEKKYAALLMKARKVQIEQKNTKAELDALKASKESSSDSTAKIAALEAELADLRKQSNEHSVEATRYKAQLSMAQGKANRLQKEIDLLKSQKPSSTLSAAAPAFQMGNNASPVSSPRITTPSSPSVTGGPVPASSSPAVSSPVAPPAKLPTTTETVAATKVTPEVVASPIVPAVESPAPGSPAPSPSKSPVLAAKPAVVEEPMASTPEIIPADNATEAQPITATITTTTESTQETEEAVEAELSMEVDAATNVESEQIAQTASAVSEELVEDQVPVDVQVRIEKPPSPVIEEPETADVEATLEHDDTEAIEETVSTPAILTTTEDAADDANTAAEVENDLNDTTEPELSNRKRHREEDEEDISGIESPTKAQKTEE